MNQISELNEIQTNFKNGVYKALETYSNVHRGSGYNSQVTTHLFEHARSIVLEHLGLSNKKYSVIFCSPIYANALIQQLKADSYSIVSSSDIKLSLGVRAIAVKKNFFPKNLPPQSGGGTTRVISKEWILWAKAPEKFEAGTPQIINIIAFAKALSMLKQNNKNVLCNSTPASLSAKDIVYQDELTQYSGQELLDKLKQTLIGKTVLVPSTKGTIPFINLDNSASTRTFESIWNAFYESLNLPAKVQKELVDEVRSIIAKQVEAKQSDYEIIFTSNTTEAINTVAQNLNIDTKNSVILSSLLEHSSNDLPWRMTTENPLVRLSVNTDGFIDLNEMETLLNQYNQRKEHGEKRIKLIAISGASNVLGTCNDLKKISQLAHKFGAQIVVDTAQLVAHRKIDVEDSEIDFLAFSAHKVYAPFGCGVLVARKSLLHIEPTKMKAIKDFGEENTAGIAALGKSLVLLQRIGMNLIQKEEHDLTVRLLEGMQQIPEIQIHGMHSKNHAQFDQKLGVVVFGMKGMMADVMAKKLALHGGIGVRYGCHCAHVIIKHILNVGPKLEKFQRLMLTVLPKVNLPGLTRVSIGLENTEDEIDRFTSTLKSIVSKSKASNSGKDKLINESEVKNQIKQKINDTTALVY